MRQRLLRLTKDDAGLSTIEVVILAPVMMLFILVLVAFGLLVDGRGAVDSAARDAARAGSLQRDEASAMSQAQSAAQADLSGTCSGSVTVRKVSSGFQAGGLFTVEVSCQVRGLTMLGLDVGTELTGRSTAPLDPYRRAA
ncbi:TadE/TadG family type IV pilus assembly protein [Streptantibioticus ferralitis]|uniref:TadE/TadG family type IV pilus assembly protein n=1 Tax=Streptantibioticus ferralitis TaxID=236510 RepID=A0ABT5Z3Q8_9ACTN|nr:TadE/TadG family type IV pilus assembly protein [Streptantibioticus ferralitis]MDF2258403.1 TadE/TadG family type IV pilus assembly protein [Streptantibioticus ferralitis]